MATQNLTPVFGNVLDALKSMFVADGTELRVFRYNGDSEDENSDEYVVQATITRSWFPYNQPGEKGNSLMVLIFETESAETYQGLKSKDATHAVFGDLMFDITDIPNAPIATLEAARYWLIECEPIGKKLPQGL